jgi:hypothetical protein
LLLAGCAGGPNAPPQIGEAYAGPATLKLHAEIDPRSPEAVTVAHGARLAIVGKRRRFVKVRTLEGKEGWTDVRQLLSTSDMDALNKLAEDAGALPSQGKASVYEPLNVHTQPNRQAPSFYRIAALKEQVDVVAHELSPRVPFEASDILPPPPPPKKKLEKPPQESSRRIPPPPLPEPPKPPANWLELSRMNPLPPELKPPPPPPPKPVPVDDWTLVRLKNGRAGWVLFGMLRMDIPDEVAQYSEGARITSYFPMSDVVDGGQTKHDWLWTTISQERQPYEFDSFRYFIWNQRRHRYETAYIEKNVKGHYPVEVHPVKAVWDKKEQTFPGFTLLLEDPAGGLVRKTYAYEFYRVVLIRTEPVAKPAAPAALTAAPPEAAPARTGGPGFFARLKQRFAALKQRWFGK